MISRRQFVGGSAWAVAGVGAFCPDRADADACPFKLGLASGDATADSVILWTRLAPEASNHAALAHPVDVSWAIARDPEFRHVEQSGTIVAVPQRAHCVHVDARELLPDTSYYYQFQACGFKSPVGRTRTLPPPGAGLAEFSVALTSCQEYSQGYFSAYRDLVAQQPDIVIHNGDYIYEAAGGDVRPYPIQGEARTLADYRALYAQYRQDPDLRAAHARFPWFVLWDDHEVVNDWGPDHFLPASHNARLSLDDHRARKRAATQAFLEHMPLRAALDHARATPPVLYRRSVIGDLLELSHLDVRSYRDVPVCNEAWGLRFTDCAAAHDAGRSMLGAEQERWLYGQFGSSGCRWNCLSQTTMLAALDRQAGPGVSYETDSWDNYPANRQRILDHIARREVRNAVSLGGNIHAFYAGVVSTGAPKAAAARVLTELVTTSVTASGGDSERYRDIHGRRDEIPSMEFFENRHRGYTLLKFTKKSITATLRIVDSVLSGRSKASTLATLSVRDGETGVLQA